MNKKDFPTYAIYKGENLIAMGTLKECAEALNVKPETVLFYGSNAYKKRTSENARRLVELEDDL